MYTLRPLKADDAPLMLEWMHDEDINQVFQTPFATFTLEKVQKFIETSNDDKNKHFACVDKGDTYLGTVSLKNIDVQNAKAEYAISFRRKAHHTGAAHAATEAILRIAFENLKLERVYLYVLSINKRANQFYEKAGFTREGILRCHVKHNGAFCDELWYGILREEWLQRHNQAITPQSKIRNESQGRGI